MSRRINAKECIGCGVCQRVCIVGCITTAEDRKRSIEKAACVDCGACQFACPKKCITKD